MRILSKTTGRSLLVGVLALGLVFAGTRSASAYEAPVAPFAGGVGILAASGLAQTWEATVKTTLNGTATTADAMGVVPGMYTPNIASTTPSESVTTDVSDCAGDATACSGLGTLTVTFAHPVVNPTIHFAGLGDSTVSGTIFHTTLTLTSSVPAAPAATMTLVSGTNSQVVGTASGPMITAVDPNTSSLCTDTPQTAGCGSVRIAGTVSSVTFTVGAVATGSTSDALGGGSADEFLVLATVDQDYGDAPATYDQGNAARAVRSDIRLGNTVTADSTGTLDATTSPHAGASASGDTDDGAALSSLSTVETSYTTTVALSGASSAGQVCGWVDFDQNGTFESGERQCAAVAAHQTSATLTWAGLSGLTAGTTYARFRVGYNTAQTSGPTGPSDSGEVEDYTLAITPLATPTAMPDSPITQQDVNVTFNPLTNDSSDPITALDPTSVRLRDPGTSTYVTSVTIADEGTYTVNPLSGLVTFDPLPAFTGPATQLTYRVTDGYAQDATSTITVQVTAVTPAPVNDVFSTPFATATTVDVLANDNAGEPSSPLVPSSVVLFDPSTSTYVTSVTIAAQGAYSVDAVSGEVTFTPEPLFRGPATPITYRVADDNGTDATATLSITVGAPPPPAADDDSSSTPQGVPVTLTSLSNDTLGPLGAALVPSSVVLKDPTSATFGSSVMVAGEGSWTVNPATGDVTFAPLPAFTGPASPITYRVTDTNGATAQAAEQVTVSPVVPTVLPDTATTPYETPTTVTVLDNDSAGVPEVVLNSSSVQLQDPAGSTWKSTVTLAGVGAYSVQPDGSVVFTPAQGYTGTASLPYRVADANGTQAQSTVSVTVTAPPAPAALPDSATTAQGVQVSILPLTNDSSDPSAPLDPTSVKLLDGATPVTTLTVPTQGTYTINPDGSVTFTPVPTFHGSATPVQYQVADKAGQLATSTISVEVTAVTPGASPDSATTPYAHAVNVPLLTNDLEGAPTAPLVPGSVQLRDPATSTWNTSVSRPAIGTYVVNPDGSLTFTPASGYSGTTADLPYRVADANGTYAQSTVRITVGAASVANPDSGSTLQGQPTIVDTLTNDNPGSGATLVPGSVNLFDASDSTYKASVTIANQGMYGVNPADATVTFTPVLTFHGNATPLTYEVTDSDGNRTTSTISVVVNEVTPVAQPDSGTTPYETPVTVPLLSNDNAGDAAVPLLPSSVQLFDPSTSLYASSVTLPGVGTYVVQPDGSVIFTPVQGFTGTTPTVTYLVDDANGTMATSTVSVTVSNPAAPVASPDTAITPQGIPVTLVPLSNDTSDAAAPLDPASVRIFDPSSSAYSTTVTIAGEGTYSVDGATGKVLFTPVLTFHDTATTLTYRVADEAGQLATSTITVTVDAITPIAGPDAATTPYLHAVAVPLLANDAEGAPTAPLVAGSVQLKDPADLGWKASVTVSGMGTYAVHPDGSVTFTPQAGYSGTTPAMPYRVADTNGTHAVSDVTIIVGAPPSASPDTTTTPQGLDVVLDVTSNDTPGTSASIDPSSVLLEDPASPGSWLSMVTIPGEGTFDVYPMGLVAYLPVPTFHGTVTTVHYRVADSNGNVAIASITVTVTPVVPTASPDTTTTPYETPVTVPLLANDTAGDPGVPLVGASVELKDPADNAWKSSVTLPGIGTYTVLPAGSVSFAPAQGYTGTTAAVTYRVADTNGTLAASTVQVTVGNPTPPVAISDPATTLQGTPVVISTLGNDTSDPAAPLNPASVRLLDPVGSTYKSSVTIAGQGTYVVDPTTGDVTFTPVKAFHGTATQVTYRVADEAGQVATATIEVVVSAVTPTATSNSATTPYAHAVIVPLVSDDSAGDPSIPLVPSTLTLLDPSTNTWKTAVTVAGVGTYTAIPDGTVGFVPATGYRGTTAPLPYRVADTNATYAQADVTITVQTPPSATPDTATTLQGQPISVSPLSNDTPGGTSTLVPGSLLLRDPSDSTYKSTVTIAGEGTYTVNPATHQVDFAPLLTFSGTAAAVHYQVTDSDGNVATSTITITVTPVIPVALPDNASTPYAHAVTIPPLANDHAGDPVVPLLPASVQLRDPVTGVWGTSVTVANVGTYDVASGSVTFTPAPTFSGSAPALTYRVADSNGTTTTSTISVVVGAPPVAAPDAATTLQNQPVTLHTLANDQPGTAATLVPASVHLVDPISGTSRPVVVVPNQGTYAVDSANGTITFTPVPWFSGAAAPITYHVADSDGNLAWSWVSVHVTAVFPNIVADSASVPFQTIAMIPVLANDSPGDASAPLDPLSVVLEDPTDGSWQTTVTVLAQGTFAVQPDGQVLFTPVPARQGTVDPVLYRVTDANGTQRTAAINVVIGNAPVAAADTATTLQGKPVTLPLLGNDHPGTGGTLRPETTQLLDPADGTYKASVTIVDEGTWSIDPATGAATFAPLPSYVGHSSPVSYEVTDSFGNTATSTARVVVAEVVPSASGDTATTPFRTPVTVAVIANDSAGRADTPLDASTVQLQDPATGTWGSTVTSAAVGTWTVKADGSVTFAPTTTYVGVTAPVSYQVADTNSTYAQATLVVTVDAPYGAKAGADSAIGSGTVPVTVHPLANDTPSHGATWVVGSVCLVPDSAETIAGAPLTSCPKTAVVAGVGTWIVNADGTMTFTAVAGFTGTATIGYLVKDSNGVEVANTVEITVTRLPSTGGPTLLVGGFGVLLLLTGGVVLHMGRRRRDDQA
jgi:CshA-type fibril repeat protein